MRSLAGILLFLTACSVITAQKVSSRISVYDSIMLVNLPELKAVPVMKSGDLPYYLDNSRLPYYRPIYEQVSSECGQVSAIGYNFTYEINRLRDLPANDSANQYPPHFTFNFANRGLGWYGVSYFHSFEILKDLGCPTVETYGGMSAGGDQRWMTGYDNYLSAMQNRVQEVYQIKAGTKEGLMQLKHWLHNHLEGSEYGGVASFYSNSPWNMKSLPEGTPEAGKKVIVYWQGLPSHAMTITGYNDSIRWDYNGDGLYTNHLDINDDGKVDLRDWEIGGLIFADGWNGGINFGDSGRCYMMYRTLAEKVYEGGIWNNAVHILQVKDLEKPTLTAKIRMNHNCRNMLRVACGVSASALDTVPLYTIEYPVFNFQGGNQYMRGGVEIEDHKNIEFGLDITPLLGLLDNDDLGKFFLTVEERDPEGTGEGYIQHFSVIHYSATDTIEYACLSDSIPIEDHAATYASLLFQESLPLMQITTEQLPEGITAEPYSHQMEVAGATGPVKWTLLHPVSESPGQQTLDTSGTFLEPGNWDYGNIPYALPFNFPFYGEDHDSIYIHPAGFVMFENTYYPWPYLVAPELLIKNTRVLAPLLCRYVDIIPAFGHGIHVKEMQDHIRISWISEADYGSFHVLMKFGLYLYEDGRIIFVYGNDFNGHEIPWSCGIGKGDGINYLIAEPASWEKIETGDAVELQTFGLPENMELSEDGLFSGTPTKVFDGVELVFCAEDHDHIKTFKNLKFYAYGLGISELEKEIEILVYPNPFHEGVMIRSKEEMLIDCRIYNSAGRLVRDLARGVHLMPGESISWDGRMSNGVACSPGIYFVNIQSEGRSITKKLIRSSP